MTRPLRADARRNRTRVLEVADEVFATEGIAVPIDEIAHRAGVGIGTIYRHFPTKEALFEAVVLQRVATLTTAAQTATPVNPTDHFFALFAQITEMGAANKALIETLTGDRTAIVKASRELLNLLGNLLVRAQKAGGIRPDITPTDLKPILAGAVTMERQGNSALAKIVRDGLRPQSAR
jgi:AcrR family transcriptional regulator